MADVKHAELWGKRNNNCLFHLLLQTFKVIFITTIIVRTCMRNSGMGTNSFFGAISLFVSIFPFVHTVKRARSLYVFTLCFLRVKPPDMCKVEKTCSKAGKVKKCPGYSGQLRAALDNSQRCLRLPRAV